MHIFFRDIRVYKRKEFFAVSAEDIECFFDIVEGRRPDHDQSWEFAMELAKR